MTPGERIRKQLKGEKVDRPGCFSGMGSIVSAAWEQLGFRFSELHFDAGKMAATAVKSAQLIGHDSIVVPFDVCVEAEALGAGINWFSSADRLIYPKVERGIIQSAASLAGLALPPDFITLGRYGVITEALARAKDEAKDFLAVGTYLMGPLTIIGQLMDLTEMYKLTFRRPEALRAPLDLLADVLVEAGNLLARSGADYITLREMGATTDLLMPSTFTQLVKPVLQKIIRGIDCPIVLHICGSAKKIIADMGECGAAAISIDSRTPVHEARKILGRGPLLFGNLDQVLIKGTPEEVTDAVNAALAEGADSIWPGCDIWPESPLANLRAMTVAVAALEQNNR